MEHERIMCLDIETVPDRTLIPEWDDGKFPPKPIWHRIVAISFVEARIEYEKGLPVSYAVECCRSGGDTDWDEQRLLSKFWRYFAERAPRVITWNGKGFDLPVLRTRAMIYGISAHSWYQRGTKWDNYTQRFAPDWHCDLMEQLSDYKACKSMSLDDVAIALGLPGKIGGHGSEVEAMVGQGEIDNVRAYCEGDCLNLFVLYVRWALLSGRIGPAGHNATLRSLIEYLESERETRSHLGAFLDRWRATSRPIPMFVPCCELVADG
jgi:predicted PolB exonuclease-like 3'-5' exonuclease